MRATGIAAAAAAMILASSCAVPPAPDSRATAVRAIELPVRNAGFEEPSIPGHECARDWDCVTHSGPGAFRYFHDDTKPGAGKRSFCIQKVSDIQPWAKVVQGVRDIVAARGSRVRFTGLIRTEAVTGSGAGPLVVVQGGGGEIVQTAAQSQQGTVDWRAFAVDFAVPPAAFLIEAGVSLEGGGTVCFDSLRLEVLPATGGKV